MDPRVDPTSTVTAFHERAVWTGVRDNDREAWLAMRHTMVTASDIAAILGEDPRRSPLAVYVDKVTPRQEAAKLPLNDPRLWGHVLEQPVLSFVADYYGWHYRRGGALLRSRRWPFLGCTLDAEVDRGSGWIPLEGKTTRLPRGWNEQEGELPIWCLLQHQAQLAVTGSGHGLVFALLQGSIPVQIEQEASAELGQIIVEVGREFVARIGSLEPPPAGATDLPALARLHPEAGLGPVDVVTLPDEAAEWLAELQELSSRRLEIETREKGLKARIVQLLGDATFGVLPHDVGGKTVIKAAWEDRAEHLVAASRSRPVRPLKKLPKGIVSRPVPPQLSDRTLAELLSASLQKENSKS